MNLSNENPYPNKCYLPFILYPPGMKRNHEGSAFLEARIDTKKEGEDFVLYISIPFCRTRCKSCPYFVSLLPEKDKHHREDIYVDALLKDLEKWASYSRWKTGLLREIYIGGGTGSILKTANLRRIVDKVFELFKVDPKYGFTLEGNARDFDLEKIDYICNSKINRLSFGVQSFQPDMLEVVGSPHAAQESERVIRAFQERGFQNIQLDLMYNMPGHTLEHWRKDLEHLARLNIQHFTIYLYRIHENTPQSKRIEAGHVVVPEDPETDMVKAMYGQALDIAKEMGFEMYMVDHFCKPGYENKYNHWNWKVYIDTLAIGPGSYSYFDGYRLGTEADIEKYIETVNRGDVLISTRTDKLSKRIQKERYIIFALLYYKIEYKHYYHKFKSSLLVDFVDEIRHLLSKGLVEITDKHMALTPLGVVWHTNVILEFFNDRFWGDVRSTKEPNWSLNGVMVDVGAKGRSFWLGPK